MLAEKLGDKACSGGDPTITGHICKVGVIKTSQLNVSQPTLRELQSRRYVPAIQPHAYTCVMFLHILSSIDMVARWISDLEESDEGSWLVVSLETRLSGGRSDWR
jgi:hypothetical protein